MASLWAVVLGLPVLVATGTVCFYAGWMRCEAQRDARRQDAESECRAMRTVLNNILATLGKQVAVHIDAAARLRSDVARLPSEDTASLRFHLNRAVDQCSTMSSSFQQGYTAARQEFDHALLNKWNRVLEGSTATQLVPTRREREMSDADVLEAVNHDAIGKERVTRYSFKSTQQIAPYFDRLPEKEVFQEVLFHDISNSGCSFYSDQPPNYSHLVAGLGTSDNRRYLTARVAHVRKCEQTGRYIIGCQFIGKVQL